ncbi:hypothetical protein C8J57DRAFT_1088025 [Mycena rebaudengoi]|nr:hypothetical protein C8J57DRAFT_1088025 [Mycena rebaudengoi]
MRVSAFRLAESISTKPLDLQEASAALLPPSKPYSNPPTHLQSLNSALFDSLYRRILRAHRALPNEMRVVGDGHIQGEFRRNRAVTNPVHIIGFLSQWKVYLADLPKGPEAKTFSGKRLDATVTVPQMSAEQIGQLYELTHATKDVWKTPPV